jgi:hypothetical protein
MVEEEVHKGMAFKVEYLGKFNFSIEVKCISVLSRLPGAKSLPIKTEF